MYNLADLPAVRAQLERDAAAVNQKPSPMDEPVPSARAAPGAPIEYARAPEVAGAQPTGARPPAVQRNSR